MGWGINSICYQIYSFTSSPSPKPTKMTKWKKKVKPRRANRKEERTKSEGCQQIVRKGQVNGIKKQSPKGP